MRYENNCCKTVLVVNTSFTAPLLMNAIGHSIIGLVSKTEIDSFNMLDYPSPNFQTNSIISEFPVVILRAKKSSQLEKLLHQLNDNGILCNVFLDTMIGRNALEQQQSTREAVPGKSNIICIAFFGQELVLRPIIKSYSVYKANDALT